MNTSLSTAARKKDETDPRSWEEKQACSHLEYRAPNGVFSNAQKAALKAAQVIDKDKRKPVIGGVEKAAVAARPVSAKPVAKVK